MKKHLRWIGSAMCLLIGLSSFGQSPYCAPIYTTPCGGYSITGVTFETISNTTTCAGSLGDYYDTEQVSLEAAGNYTMTIATEAALPLFLVYVWFDWDNSGTFEETEMLPGVGVPGVQDYTVPVVVPPTAIAGVKSGFRIRLIPYNAIPGDIGAPDPCLPFSIGEAEDYSFLIVDPLLPGCAENLAPDGDFQCQNGVTLSWDAPTTGEPATEYKVYLGTGGTYTIINGATTTATSMVVPGPLDPSTIYNWYVVPSNANGDAIGCDSPVSFTTNPLADPSLDLPDAEQTFCIGVAGDLGGVIADGNGDGSTWSYAWTPATPGLSDADQDSAVFTAASIGDYRFFLSLADDSGCVAVDSMDIKVEAIPDVNIQGAVANFCFPTDYSISISTTSTSIQWEAAGDNTNYVDLAGEVEDTLAVPYVNGLQYYRVRLMNGFCSFFSDTVSTTGTPAPATPQIEVVGANAENKFCVGDSAVLTVMNYDDVNWVEAGITSETLTVKTAGTVTAVREEGICSSDTSITFDVNPLPLTPALNFESDAVKCPNAELALYPDVMQAGGVWSNGATTDTIYPDAVGVYSLEVTNEFGCSSTSNEVFVTLGADHEIPEVDAPNGLELCGGTDLILEVTNHNSGITWDDDDMTSSKTLVVTRTGTYTATFTSSEGCTFVSESVTITNAAGVEDPIISAGPENGLCEGEEVTLTVTNYDQGVWSDAASTNSKSLIVTSSGAYSVVCVATNGCEATGAIDLALSPKPEQPVIQENGEDIVVNPTLADSFVWFFEGDEIPGENGALLSPTEVGHYTAAGVNGDCWGEQSASFLWPTDGIMERDLIKDLRIYPNPNSGTFIIGNSMDDTHFEVVDVQGRVICTFEADKLTGEVTLETVETGVYWIRSVAQPNHHSKIVVLK